MGKIVLLDDLTINQIAAGEVIERPASAVKELVENSIDAGAKNITVDVKNGGISYIRVIDDGSGIMPDDMEIAFERHATSKIRRAEDLEIVKSMGFRGEALASIAAISKIELVSKTADSDIGYKVVVEGGNIIDKHEEGTSKGTSITIKDLFYNTPVRYKFLRKDFTELGYIEDAITRIALANPNVAIKLISIGKTIIQTNGSGKLEDCIYSIYGKEIAQNILPVDYRYEDMHIEGCIGKPAISRSNRTNQLFFVNNRYIKDKTLTSAAEQGFKGLVTIGKHGFLVLNIEMDPKKVDVNVHPTKLEVRFQDDGKVFKAVYNAIKETLLKGDLVNDTEKDYNDLTPNDMLKEIKNKDRVEAWGLNKSFANSQDQKDITQENNKPLKEETGELEEFGNFKSTIKGLDEETRTRFVQEIAKATTQEQISKVLNDFTAFLKNKEAYKEKNIGKDDVKIEKMADTDELITSNDKLENTVQDELTIKKEESTTQEGNQINESRDNTTQEGNQINESKDNTSQWENIINDNTENKTETEDREKVSQKEDQINEDEENNTQEVNRINDNTEDETETEDREKATQKDDQINENEENNTQEVNRINDNTEDKTETEDREKAIQKEDQINENVGSTTQEGNQTNDNREDKKEDADKEELSFEEMYKKLFGRDIEDAKKQYQEKLAEEEEKYPISPIKDNEISLFEQNKEVQKVPYKFVGIVFNTYIILTINDDMYILDQHAAHERIMYEKVKKNYYTDGEKDSQIMLLPDIINLNIKEMGIFKDNKRLFERAGFIVDEFGDSTVKLTGVPEFCLELNTKEIFLETLDEINTVARTAKQELEEKFLSTVACKAAVKANMALTKEEVDKLMDELLKLPNPFTCPHGRPTVIKMSKTDIEKKFARR